MHLCGLKAGGSSNRLPCRRAANDARVEFRQCSHGGMPIDTVGTSPCLFTPQYRAHAGSKHRYVDEHYIEVRLGS